MPSMAKVEKEDGRIKGPGVPRRDTVRGWTKEETRAKAKVKRSRLTYMPPRTGLHNPLRVSPDAGGATL